jgi:hypothetical protein
MAESSTTRYMLTTVDNPFNPFTEYDEWQRWDIIAGYNTSSLLARITTYSHDLSDADQDLAIDQAMDEIVRENVSGMWRKVSEDSFDLLNQVGK